MIARRCNHAYASGLNVAEGQDKAVTEYARKFILARRREGDSWATIGEMLGVTHPWVLALANPEKYGDRRAGPDVERALARRFFGGSVDALRAAATRGDDLPDVAVQAQAIRELESGGVERGQAERAVHAVIAFKAGSHPTVYQIAELARVLIVADGGKSDFGKPARKRRKPP